MSINPLVCADGGLAEALNSSVVELSFEGKDNTANGATLALIPAQKSASARVHLGIAGATGNTAAVLGAAAVEALIKRPNGSSLSAQEKDIAKGVENAIKQVETLVDTQAAVVFALGGLNARDVVKAELLISSGSTKPALELVTSKPSVRIPEPVELDANDELKKASGAAVDLPADLIIAVGGQEPGSSSTIVGCFVVPDASELVIAAGVTVKLKLHVKQ